MIDRSEANHRLPEDCFPRTRIEPATARPSLARHAPPRSLAAPGPLPTIAVLAFLLVLCVLLVQPTLAATDSAQVRWIATWTSSPQAPWDGDFVLPSNLPERLQDRTIRQVARISLGGSRLRIRLSNEYGDEPLVIGAVSVALAGSGSAIVPSTARTVTFGGSPSAVLPPGAPLVSDPIDLLVADLARVSVSIFLPWGTTAPTFHWDARQTGWIAEGDRTDAPALASAETTSVRLFLSAILVERADASGAVVVMGDSITDGNGASTDADTRWPDFLAARLAPRSTAVLNAGISGARLLGDRMGSNALARFDRDVLGQPGVHTMIVLLGINDIAWPGTAFDPRGSRPDAGALIAGYRQLAARARSSGLRIIGATLLPFEGALEGTEIEGYHDRAKELLRQEINAWIRGSEAFDAVIDFDALLRDPGYPARLLYEFDSGDHLHPGDDGNRAMAGSVDIDLLTATTKELAQ